MVETSHPIPWNIRIVATIALLVVGLAVRTTAQTDDGFGDAAADPVKLFELGQSAHARRDYEKALEFYEQAIKVRPEFAEAEFQRGNALASLGRTDEAEAAFRRATQLKKNWALPYSALATLLTRGGRDHEAELSFREALTIDQQDNVSLRMLSEIRRRAGDTREALEFAQRATHDPEAPSSAWIVLAMAQRATGDKSSAKASLNRVLASDSDNLAALIERSDLLAEEKDYVAAINDLKAADKQKPGDKVILSRLAFVYQQAGRLEDAQAIARAAGLEVQATTANGKTGVIGTPAEIEAANSDDPATARKALEKLLEKNPHNALLSARLGASFRTVDPNRSLEFFRAAASLQPDNADYVVGYASALVQARRFADAAQILRRVTKSDPKNYTAHANLATALYELKQYGEALPEYDWLLAEKPNLVVAHYFIATAHDYLGEYPEALASYEKFLANADSQTNQLEIEKVKLRLPTLRRQIQLGQGVKRKQ